jgi:hypothetical protein
MTWLQIQPRDATLSVSDPSARATPQLSDICATWLTRPEHVLTESARRAYIRSGLVSADHVELPDYLRVCHSLGFYFAPNAPLEGANVLGMLMVWFFVVDDQVDDGIITDFDEAERFLDTIRDVFLQVKADSEKVHAPANDTVALGGEALSAAQKLSMELHAALRNLCHDRPSLYQRLLDDFLDWLDAVAPFIFQFRTHQSTTEAQACRMINIGARLTMTAMEIVNGTRLSLRLVNHPYAEHLRQVAFRHVILQNDLASYHRDAQSPERRKNNLLSVLMTRHGLLLDDDVTQGLVLATRELLALEGEIRMHIELLRTACRTLPKHEVEAYAALVQELVGGSWAWSLYGGRYHAQDNIIPELRVTVDRGYNVTNSEWMKATAH